MLLEQVDDRERDERRHERGALLQHVAALEDRADDRRVGRRAADAELLERPHERRLGVARRRLRLVSLGLEATSSSASPSLDVRQTASSSSAASSVVAALHVGGEEAAERDHGAGGAELRVLARRRRAADAQRDRLARARPSSATRSCASRSARRARARRGSARPATAVGSPERVAGGRIASCASCAFFTLRSYCAARRAGTRRRRARVAWSRAAVSAGSDRVVESVRMYVM